jgi:hypothetical protein
MRRLAVGILVCAVVLLGAASIAVAAADSRAASPPSQNQELDPAPAAPAGLSAADWADISGQVAVQLGASAADAVPGFAQAADFGLAIQQAYLKGAVSETEESFGFAVAVSGDTVVVGAYGEDGSANGVNGAHNNGLMGSGAAYVFVRSGAGWTQQAYLKASNPGIADYFGYAVAISGDTAVVGSVCEDGSSTGVNGADDNSTDDAGAAYVFVRSGTTWTQQAYLKASNTGSYDYFGLSVAVVGDTVVVGAGNEDGSATGVNGVEDNNAGDAGAAYVFVRSGTTWTQQAYLKASNAEANDNFGVSVGISGDSVVVGARYESSGATQVDGNQADNSVMYAGAAYVFVRSGTTWAQQAYLKASNAQESDFFGYSVAVSGDTAVVGALAEDSNATQVDGNQADNRAPRAGAAYVFVRSGTTWSQQAYLKASNAEANDNFGVSVGISGDSLVVGAVYESGSAAGVNGNAFDNSCGTSGAAYVFARSGTTWTQQAYLKASNPGVADYFGNTVAVSDDTIVIGAYTEDGSATGVNGANNNLVLNAGAAYVFVAPSAFASSLTYTGPTIDADGDSQTTLSALLACPEDPSCAAGQTVQFFVDVDQSDTISLVNELVATGTTGSDGRVAVTWTHATGLKGAYDVFVNYDGTPDCAPSATTSTVVLVPLPTGVAAGSASGSGRYPLSGADVVTFNFSVLSRNNTPAGLSGTLVWAWGTQLRRELRSIAIAGYELINLPGYARAAVIRGNGLLTESIVFKRFPIVQSSTAVTFVAIVADGGYGVVGGKTVNNPDAFGLDILGVDVPGETAPMQLTSGSITIR